MMESDHEIEEALSALKAAVRVDIREDGRFLPGLAPPHWEVRRQGHNVILHIWSDERNLVRRVTRLAESDEQRVILEVTRFGKVRPSMLEFVRRDLPRVPSRVSRAKFFSEFERIAIEAFPDAAIADRFTFSPNLEHSFSSLYPRGSIVENGRKWAVLGASPSDSAASIDGALAYGLLWFDYLRRRASARPVFGLRLILPQRNVGVSAHRAAALDPSLHLEIFALKEDTGRVVRVDLADAGNLEFRLPPCSDGEPLPAAAQSALEEVRSLVAGTRDSIESTRIHGTREIALSWNGFEFARWTMEGICFGPEGRTRILNSRNRPELARLIQKLRKQRCPHPADTSHILYRTAPERWLQSVIASAPERIDAILDPRFLYEQLSAYAGGDRGVVDLLGLTRQGRLIVMELKASEDIQLPIQAADYWLRIRRHQVGGDLSRLGYFKGASLDSRPPQLWIIAPGLQFHSSTDTLVSFLSPALEFLRIGLNESWRGGIRVIFRR